MVDLETYRARVGVFSGQRKCCRGQLSRFVRGSSRFGWSAAVRVSLLFIFCINAALLVFDGVHRKQPGPRTVNSFPYTSDQEKVVFLKVKSLELYRVKCVSHLSFLNYCKQKGQVPAGLLTTLPMSAARPDKTLEEKINALQQDISTASLDIIIDHYANRAVPQLEGNINEAKEELRALSDSTRYQFLLDSLKNFILKEQRRQTEKKRKKLESMFSNISDFRTSFATNFHVRNRWLPLLSLSMLERTFLLSGRQLCDNLVTAGVTLLSRRHVNISFQPTSLPLPLLKYSPHPSIHIHHNNNNHFVTTTNLRGNVHIFDSLNTEPSEQLLSQIKAIYSPDNSLPTIYQVKINNEQIGGTDCGLFCLAYASELADGNDPTEMKFDQSAMREHFLNCLEKNEITPFPKFNTTRHQRKTAFTEITKDTSHTEKWTTPKRTAKTQAKPNTPNFLSPNRFSALQQRESKTRTKKKESNTKEPKDNPPSQEKSQKKTTTKMNVTNISSRNFTPDEIELLSLGLSFCPSVRDFDRAKFSDDMFSFFRRMKLKEFFSDIHGHEELSQTAADQEPQERKMHNWNSTNTDWYPDNVRNGRSQGLMELLSKITENFKLELRNTKSKSFNNLTSQQRTFLKQLAEDKSITIKPADKGGSVVIMDTKTYEEHCLNILNNTDFYEVLNEDPTPQYKQQLETIIQYLLGNNYINESEAHHLTKNERTSTFYCLPKIHKAFTDFPQLRPICSGYNSVTNKLSEWVDGFLFPAAKKTLSYIKDSTDFIKKLPSYTSDSSSENIFLVTMDVVNLYPNIDHEEGISAAKTALDNRKNQRVPTTTLCEMIRFILNSNTMSHQNLFFHQTKGCAMGTNMAVNYANLFMSNFEEKMLQMYEEKYKRRPELWLRFIDDIFFIWKGDAEDLKEFIKFCNDFSTSQNYKSNIKFTSFISPKEVDFLDITISINSGTIKTQLFTKPTAAHLYVHRLSDHPNHVIKSGPKSQFLRIRRLCSDIQDYDKHASQFQTFYQKRGYNANNLRKTINEVKNMNREDLLNPAPKPTDPKNQRIPLVINWHHKFSRLPGILNKTYNEVISKFPELAQNFPAPPLISFRKNKTLKDILCAQKTNTRTKPAHSARCTQKGQTRRGRPCDLCPSMSEKDSITNTKTKTRIPTKGGNCLSHHLIYAAECTKCRLIYVGSTTQQLNRRFNGHRHDARSRPEACELAEHFHNKITCNFEKDLSITIIETLNNATITQLERREDYWITTLKTHQPTGLNRKANSEVLGIHRSLFG